MRRVCCRATQLSIVSDMAKFKRCAITVGDASKAKARKPSQGLEGVNDFDALVVLVEFARFTPDSDFFSPCAIQLTYDSDCTYT